MTRSRFAFYLGRIPILEVLAIVLGVAGMAGNFSVFGTEDQNWWNGMLIVCGALSACISLFADNFIPGHRKAVSAVSVVVGGGLLFFTLRSMGTGPNIGAPLVLALSVALLLSALLRSVRGALSALLMFRMDERDEEAASGSL